jgi:phosphate transport system protein
MLMHTVEGELQRLQKEVLAMGSLVESTLVDSVDVLKRRDLNGARRLITLDQRIYKKRFAIEMDCLTLIATRRPLDGHLRTITATLEITSELERMADYAKDIVGSPFVIIDGSFLNLLTDMHRLATRTQGMLHRALQAFVGQDIGLVRAIPPEDTEMNALYNQVNQELMSLLKNGTRAQGDSRALINQARYLARIARYLNRAADQVGTICQWVTFAVTGEMQGEGEGIPRSATAQADAHEPRKEDREESLIRL